MVKNTLAIILCLIVAIPQSHCSAKNNAVIAETIADIVRARALTEQSVLFAASHMKANNANYKKAYQLYAEALANYSAWDEYVASSLNGGTAKNLLNDENYQKESLSASKSATRFIDFVDKQTEGPSNAIIPTISSLADLGIKLWTAVSKQRAQERADAAKYFIDRTKWRTWGQITSEPSSKSMISQGQNETAAK